MALTKGQEKCINTLFEPLAVSAGAGSGKTFTLTRRIVNALSSHAIDDIDQVMAITFTTKAAQEIKSRVKAALSAEGLTEQALKVDNAWISTIHGMCSRILRSNAIALGIDPAFTVIDESVCNKLIEQATEYALAQGPELVGSEDYEALFNEYKARSGGMDSGSIEDMIKSLMMTAACHMDGMQAIVTPTSYVSKSVIVQKMLNNARQIKEAAESTGSSSNGCLAFIEATDKAIVKVENIMCSGGLHKVDIVELLSEFPYPSASFGSATYKAFAKDMQSSYNECMREILLGRAAMHLKTLMVLADCALREYERLKAEQSFMDNTDLLVKASRALTDYPEIGQEYAQRFKLIMIDEFQDTDQLQVDMISRMAGENGERLCVVGDAQQSIYRFRGADISVYRKHLENVRKKNPDGIIYLSDNFRSHAAVLSFVDRIFKQNHVFGRSFMQLAPGRDESRVKTPYLGSAPRAEMQLIMRPWRGVDDKTSVQKAAQGIAERFYTLREEGHSANDMVILLGSTKHANIYAQALRDYDFSCVVVKGSIFNTEPEVNLMLAVARMLINPHDTDTLYKVLSSDLCSLTVDDLLEYSTIFDAEGHAQIASLDRRLFQLAYSDDFEHLSPTLRSALRLCANAYMQVGERPLSQIMMTFVQDSGWIDHLDADGAEGQSVAANIYKVIRLCEELEATETGGVASLLDALERRVAEVKDAPGALSATGNEFVRIMTIHASKGLEFPIVAIAEMRTDSTRTKRLVLETMNGVPYASLSLGNTLTQADKASFVKKAMSAQDEEWEEVKPNHIPFLVGQPDKFRNALLAYAKDEELQESRRLLYVALTRAKEALIVSMRTRINSKSQNGISEGIYADIQSAFCEPGGIFLTGSTLYNYCEYEKALMTATFIEPKLEDVLENAVSTEDDGEGVTIDDLFADEEKEPEFQYVVVPEPYKPRFDVVAPSSRDEVFSYSSLPHLKEETVLISDHGISPYDEIHEKRVDSDPFVQEGEEVAEKTTLGQTDACSDFILFDWDDDGDRAAWDQIRLNLSDADKATDFGTVFHRLAQLAVLAHPQGESPLVIPSAERIKVLSQAYRLGMNHCGRLTEALNRWFGSTLAKKVVTFNTLKPEAPFFIELVEGDVRAYMEGEIDLLACREGQLTNALVIDYKTGGHDGEDTDTLHRKHLMQATCYAYAVLNQGFESVDLVFVRVERESSHMESETGLKEPQYVSYHYTQEDVESLRTDILNAFKGR